MTAIDDEAEAAVKTALATVGRTAIWRFVTKTFNKETNATTEVNVDRTITITPPMGCIVEYAQSPGGNLAASPQTVKRSGFRIITSPIELGQASPTPQKDLLVIADKVYRVVRVDPIYSGERIAAYKIFVVGHDSV